MPSIKALNESTFLGTKRKNATIRAQKLERARAGPASVFPKPSAIVIPPSKYPPMKSIDKIENIIRAKIGIKRSYTFPFGDISSLLSSSSVLV